MSKYRAGDFVVVRDWKDVLFKLIYNEGGCWLAEVHDKDRNLMKGSGHAARSFNFDAAGIKFVDHNAYYHVDAGSIMSYIRREPITYKEFIGE